MGLLLGIVVNVILKRDKLTVWDCPDPSGLSVQEGSMKTGWQAKPYQAPPGQYHRVQWRLKADTGRQTANKDVVYPHRTGHPQQNGQTLVEHDPIMPKYAVGHETCPK